MSKWDTEVPVKLALFVISRLILRPFSHFEFSDFISLILRPSTFSIWDRPGLENVALFEIKLLKMSKIFFPVACSKVKLSYSDKGPWPIGCDWINHADIVGEEDLYASGLYSTGARKVDSSGQAL